MASIVLDILWRDHGAQKGLQGISKDTQATAAQMGKLKKASDLALLGVAAGVIKFGRDSVRAYSDAQDAQKALGFAFQKFPALADTNQKALQKLNTELQKKTRFDDDNIASGQAVLAQFKLTGKQLTEVTPLLLDYASKTGKDIPQAAQDVGKALLGNAKALKNIGISYKSTGDASKDFTNITGLMRSKIGGFADQEGKTFSGQLAIMKNQFGELEETAGSKLVPALTAVVGELTDVAMWIGNNSKVIVPLGAALVGVAGSIWLANKAGKAWATTQAVSVGFATKAVGGLKLLKLAFTGVALTAEGAGRAMKIAQLAIPGVGLALFAVTTAMQMFASKSDDSTGSAADFSSAMQSIEGSVTRATAALNDNVRAQAVSALQSKGAYEQAHLLGIAYGTVTDAALGNKDAIAEVNRVIGAAVGPSKDLSAAHVAAKNAANGLAGTMGEVARQSIKDTAAEQTRRGALVGSVAPTVTLTAMTNDLKTAQKNLRTEIQKVIDKFTILKDGALSQDAANSAWQASLDGVSESVKTNGRSLSSHTTKGRSNREAIRNMITALNDKITSDVKASGSTKGLTEKMKDGEAKIRAAAKAAGYNKEQVDAMIKKMLKTPHQVKTEINTPGMKAAQTNVDTLTHKIKNINGRTVTVRVNYAGVGSVTAKTGGHTQTVHFRAAGGVLPGYTPGRDVHMFHSATGGTLGLSGGEAVMRPEWTNAVGGAPAVNRMNAAARSGGAPAVRSMMGFAGGGVYREILVRGDSSGSANVDSNYAKAAQFGGTGSREMARSAGRLAAALAAIAAANDTSGPIGGKGYADALRFARSQAGKPYIWAGVGPRGYDCCIVGPVRVYGPDGAKPIRDIQQGDRVYSYDEGKLVPHEVLHAWQSLTQQVFSVRTRNRTVTASANHPFMRLVRTTPPKHLTGVGRGAQTPGRYEVQWARLDQLRRGDLVVQPRSMRDETRTDARLSDGTPVDADVAWLIGAVVGDGTITDRHVRLCLFGEKRDRAAAILRDRWGCKASPHATAGIIAGSKALVTALADLGMRVLGPDKRVPDAVWSWPMAAQQSFLDGYCDADGHRPANPMKHGDRTYHSASRELIEDVRAMHIMLGQPVSNITTTKRTKPITIRGVLVKKALPLHTVTVWSGKGRGEAAMRRDRGLAAWLDESDFTVAAVLGIKDEGVQETFDLEVEGAHNFVADGVVVHNSGFMSALDNVVHGRNPYHRLFSTSFFHGQANGPGGFHHNKRSPFMVGITHAGVGHMAGTLNGVNVESSGGRGVHLGSGARGWRNGLFRMHYGLAGGGVIGDPPFDLLDPRGQYYDPSLLRALYGTPILHDGGGRIPPGDTLVRNKTRQPERVLTGAQNRAFEKLTRVGGGGGGGITININATFPNYVGNRSELKRTLQDMGRNGDMRAILASAGR